MIVRNININNLEERVRVSNFTKADLEGELLLTSGLDTMNHVIVDNELAGETITVKVFPLDKMLVGTFLVLKNIDLGGSRTLI